MFQHLSIYQWIGWPLFLVITTGLVLFSRKSLFDPSHYGFYRFFAFETLLGVLFLTGRSWARDPFSPNHLLSGLLLIFSLTIAGHSLALLRRQGLPLGFWSGTTRLVSTGVYRYIRHPLYTSLIFLGCAVYIRNPLPVTTMLIFSACGLLAATAIVEEQQNVKKFGEEYLRYMNRSKRFIPFIF